jgi:hypothetical protein
MSHPLEHQPVHEPAQRLDPAFLEAAPAFVKPLKPLSELGYSLVEVSFAQE